MTDPASSTEKLPPSFRYYDVTSLFSWPYRSLVSILYPTPIRPEIIVGLSLASGLLSAFFLAQGRYGSILLAAMFIYLKNLLDTVDGHLARARGQVTPIGRFIDSLSDFVVFTFVMMGMAIGLLRSGHPVWLTWLIPPATLSLFLQCSYFNYYLVTYVRRVNAAFPARTREEIEAEDSLLLRVLKEMYAVTYGWQDRWVEKLDGWGKGWSGQSDSPYSFDLKRAGWYNHKAFLTAESVLCFGTQIGFLILCSILNRLDLFVIGIVTVWNMYAVGLYIVRILFFRGLGR